MKRFAFRLERLLKLRRTFEHKQAKNLGEVVQVEERERQAYEESAERHADARRQLGEPSPVANRAGVRMNLKRAVDAFGDRADAARESHEDAVRRVAEERERYTDARKDRRTLERLREKQRAEWEVETTRREQAAIDEVASRQSQTSEDS